MKKLLMSFVIGISLLTFVSAGFGYDNSNNFGYNTITESSSGKIINNINNSYTNVTIINGSSYNETYYLTTSAWNGNSTELLQCVNNASYLSTFNSSYDDKNTSQWIRTGGNIYYQNLTGKVGVQASSPLTDFQVGTAFYVNTTSGYSSFGVSQPTSLRTFQVSYSTNWVEFKSTGANRYALYDVATLNNTLRGAVESNTGGSTVAGTLPFAGVLATNNNYPLQFGTNAKTRVTIDILGNLGIGTVIPAAKLEVNGSSTPEVRVSNDNASSNSKFGLWSDNTAVRMEYRQYGTSASGTLAGVNVANCSAYVAQSGVNSTLFINGADTIPFVFGGVTNEFARIVSTGVNVGTTKINRVYTSSTNANIEIGDGSTAQSSYLRLNPPATKEGGIAFSKGGTNQYYLYQPISSTDLRLYSTTAPAGDKITFTADGKMGIGTTTPNAKLDVNGSINALGNLTITGNTTLNGGNATLMMPTLKKIDGVTACTNGDALKWETGGRIYCG